MIDRAHDLPIDPQAEVLNIGRGSVYYLPRPVSETDLAIVHRLDRLHLELLFAGSRMLRGLLAFEECKIGLPHPSLAGTTPDQACLHAAASPFGSLTRQRLLLSTRKFAQKVGTTSDPLEQGAADHESHHGKTGRAGRIVIPSAALYLWGKSKYTAPERQARRGEGTSPRGRRSTPHDASDDIGQ